jgi:hypothetical protein
MQDRRKMKKNIQYVLLALLVVLSVYAYRYTVLDNFFLDDLVYKDMVHSGYPDILQSIVSMFGNDSLITISILSSMLFVLFLGLFLDKYNIKSKNKFIIMLVLVFSPQFLSIFTVSIRQGFELSVLMISVFLLCQKKTAVFVIGLIMLIFYSTLAPLNIFVAFMVMVLVRLLEKRKLNWSIFLLLSLLFHLPMLKDGFPNLIVPYGINNIKNFITDFGGIYGVSLFTILLAGLGMFLYWSSKTKIQVMYLLMILSTLLAFFQNDYLYLLLPIYSIIAGFSIHHYQSRNWKLDVIKSMTLLVIACGLLFSFISYFDRQSEIDPSKGFLDSLEFLKNQPSGNVLTYHEYGYIVEAISGNDALLDSRMDLVHNSKQIYNDTQAMYYSRNLKATSSLFDKYSVRYIITTPDMRTGLVWSKEREGLLFLFRNDEVFTQIYSEDGIDIWEVAS